MKRWIPCLMLVGAIALAGCGDSDDGSSAQEVANHQAAVHKRQMARLDHKVAALKKQKAAAAKKAQAAAAAAKKSASSSPGSSSNGDLDSYLASLPGQAGLVVGAPGGDGPRISGGDLTTGFAWSTSKVPIVERLLDDVGGPSGLSSAQADEINRAITLSDNDAAAALFSDLEAKHGGLAGASSAVGDMLRAAGDSETQISTVGRGSFSTYGQTEWSLENQNRYMAALAGGCLADQADTSYIRSQMSEVGGSDTYGLGSSGESAYWKGGWGPGTDGKYLVRQMGVMNVGGKDMVVTLAAIPDDGTFASGETMATDIATWAAQHLSGDVSGPVPCG